MRKNSVILCACMVLILGVSAFADNTAWEQANESDGIRIRLCRQNLSVKKHMQNCLREIFYKRHTETYYGSEMYFSKNANVKLAVVRSVAEKWSDMPERVRDGQIIEKLRKAYAVILVKDEMDMPYYHIYVINRKVDQRRSFYSQERVLMMSADTIDDVEPVWGFSGSRPIFQYSY